MRFTMLLIGASAGALMVSSPALAEDQSGQGGASTTSDAQAETPVAAAQSNDPGDIVVTARRVNERLQDVPIAVTALSGESLQNAGVRDLTDISSVAPSLNIRTSSNDSQAALVALRGQVPAGVLITTDSAVGVYVDGINNPRAIGFRGALVDIARVEVLRGPQGTLYGRNTTGGAISVITNAPTPDRIEGSARITLGNYAYGRMEGVLNLPLSDNVAVRLVGVRSIRDGYGSDFDGRDLYDDDSTYLRARIRGEFGALTADAYFDYQRSNNNGPILVLTGLTQYTTPVGGLTTSEAAAELGISTAAALPLVQQYLWDPTNRDRAYRSGSRGNFSNFTGYSAGLDLNLDLSDNLRVRSITGWRENHRRNAVDYDGTPFNAIYTRFRINDTFLSQELQLLGNFGRLSFVAGLYGSYEDGYEVSAPATILTLNTNAGRQTTTSTGGYARSTSLAVFGQANYRITDQLTLTLGARYTTDTKRSEPVTHNNPLFVTLPLENTFTGCIVPAVYLQQPGVCRGLLENTYSDPSWLASLDWHATEDILFYGKISRGFRAGGQNLRGATVTALTPFAPETITEYEVGMKAQFFDRRLTLNVAAYHDDYSGVQRTVSLFSPTGVSTSLVSNAANARIDGVEVEVIARPTQGLTLSGNVAYTNARYVTFVDATGDRSNEDWPTPDWTYSITGRYELPVGPNQLALQVDYTGQSSQNLYPAAARQQGNVTQPAYALLNGRVSFTLPSSRVEFAIFGRNLTNEVYLEGALSNEGLGINVGMVGQPRTYGVEASMRF